MPAICKLTHFGYSVPIGEIPFPLLSLAPLVDVKRNRRTMLHFDLGSIFDICRRANISLFGWSPESHDKTVSSLRIAPQEIVSLFPPKRMPHRVVAVCRRIYSINLCGEWRYREPAIRTDFVWKDIGIHCLRFQNLTFRDTGNSGLPTVKSESSTLRRKTQCPI